MVRFPSWSSIALVSILTLNSGAAMSKGIENVSISDISVKTESVKMANIFQTIQRVNQTVNTVNQINLREERRQQAEQRKQQREIARKEALEKRRLEAERRRQYLESLSPEQRQAYIKKQRAAQAKRDEVAAQLLLMIFSSGSGSTQQDNGRYFTCSAGSDSNGGDILYKVYVRAGESRPNSGCN